VAAPRAVWVRRLLECRGFGGGISVIRPSGRHPGEPIFARLSRQVVFDGRLGGRGARFFGSGFPATTAVFRAALSAVTAKRGGFGRLFCPWQVHVSRCKVALGSGVGRCFAGAPIPFPNPALERDWPISVLFAACGFLTFGAPAKFRGRPAPQFER